MKKNITIYILLFAITTSFSPESHQSNLSSMEVCDLDDWTYYEDMERESSDFVRFYNQEGNTVEFIGKMPHDVHGKMKLAGNKLTVSSGNVTGSFTLLQDCTELVGSFKMGVSTYVINYHSEDRL